MSWNCVSVGAIVTCIAHLIFVAPTRQDTGNPVAVPSETRMRGPLVICDANGTARVRIGPIATSNANMYGVQCLDEEGRVTVQLAAEDGGQYAELVVGNPARQPTCVVSAQKESGLISVNEYGGKLPGGLERNRFMMSVQQDGAAILSLSGANGEEAVSTFIK